MKKWVENKTRPLVSFSEGQLVAVFLADPFPYKLKCIIERVDEDSLGLFVDSLFDERDGQIMGGDILSELKGTRIAIPKSYVFTIETRLKNGLS